MGVCFEGDVSFNSAKIEGLALFRGEPDEEISPAHFEGEADFTNARFGSQADFRGVVFKQKAIFNSAKIGVQPFLAGDLRKSFPRPILKVKPNSLTLTLEVMQTLKVSTSSVR